MSVKYLFNLCLIVPSLPLQVGENKSCVRLLFSSSDEDQFDKAYLWTLSHWWCPDSSHNILPHWSDYIIPLHGHCLVPKPQGSFGIKVGATNISFNNIIGQIIQFNFSEDNYGTTESIKQVGKLVVTSQDSARFGGISWTYFHSWAHQSITLVLDRVMRCADLYIYCKSYLQKNAWM